MEKYCYDNDLNNCTIYGGLYQWAEAVQYKNGATDTTLANPQISGNVKGICPSGWHIPTFAEFQTIGSIVSDDSNKLKAIGQGTGSSAGSDSIGFSALLGGYREYDNRYRRIGYYVYYWSSNESNNLTAFYMGLDFLFSNIYLNGLCQEKRIQCSLC